MYYTPKFFAINELIPPEIYTELGDSALVLLDDRILRIIDGIREHFGRPVIVNTWKNGGQFSQRGFRTIQEGTALHSPHFYGRAMDFDVEGYTADQVRAEIISDRNADNFQLITGMETNITWVHLDVANRYSTNGIVTFNA